jgi:hypothetical protein
MTQKLIIFCTIITSMIMATPHSDKFFFMGSHNASKLTYFNSDNVRHIKIEKDRIIIDDVNSFNTINYTPVFDGLWGSNFMYESLDAASKHIPGLDGTSKTGPENLYAARAITRQWITILDDATTDYYNPRFVKKIVVNDGKIATIIMDDETIITVQLTKVHFYGVRNQ